MAVRHYAQAREAAEEVLAVYEKRLGGTHPHFLICNLDISSMLWLEKDYQAAEAKAQSAADGLEDRLSPVHPYTLAAKMVLASVWAAQLRLTEAQELEATVVAAREQFLGPQHPDTLRCRLNMLLTQQALGLKTAPAQRQEAIGDLSGLIGDEHPDVNTALRGDRLLCAIDPLPF